jgi:hypothetical protein
MGGCWEAINSPDPCPLEMRSHSKPFVKGMGLEKDVEALTEMIQAELRLEAQSRPIIVAPTAPAAFRDRADIELAHRFHALTNLPHVLPTLRSAGSQKDLAELQTRINTLNDQEQPHLQSQESKKAQTICPMPASAQNDPQLAHLWRQFNLETLTEREDEKEGEDDDIDDLLALSSDEEDDSFLEDLLTNLKHSTNPSHPPH